MPLFSRHLQFMVVFGFASKHISTNKYSAKRVFSRIYATELTFKAVLLLLTVSKGVIRDKLNIIYKLIGKLCVNSYQLVEFLGRPGKF